MVYVKDIFESNVSLAMYSIEKVEKIEDVEDVEDVEEVEEVEERASAFEQ